MISNTITSVITGDIIKSRAQVNPEVWITVLKRALSYLSNDKAYWEIYRGDSFQIEIKDIYSSFIAALYIKACIKSIHGLDVRLAIGIGNKTYEGENVTESNGEAFVFSGETLETLKKEKQNLRIKTNSHEIDETLNLYFKLALISMDSWTVNLAEIVKLSIEKPDALQSELGKLIGINQNAISTRQKRAHLDEIKELDLMYRQKINALT
ncbi:transcriptional regulator [Flavivirga spongiicola]|uniref:Transcriptional regulator n=1 Tax=Flavivirga spongiicola TaxID=421621 RepID=A0ABU7XQ78_9FLAO|nr:transcriptional regulator [Flavivirga sp. MEBiC05379]MDO5977686.1 transcriptional regulator [Flavivirga sp. MEBiC05379]